VKPVITFKTGSYTQNEQEIPLGGKLLFGITASSPGAIITNLRIQRISDGNLITEMDKGMYLDNGELDFEYYANKSSADQEIWTFFVMNSNRDTATVSLIVNLTEGSAWSEINHYPSLLIGMQANTELPGFVDLHTGNVYTKSNVSGHEADIDIAAFVYTTSGILSPTLCCPGYTGSTSITGFYPEIASWPVRNSIAYDYYSSDNNLVDAGEFDQAMNDSLLVTSFKPDKVSGLCKYCTAGRIIPCRTQDGKYGLIKVHYADLTETGYMELEIKIQK